MEDKPERNKPADWFRNIILNMQATGPAAVLCVTALSIAAVGIWGSEKLGHDALTILSVFIGLTSIALAQNTR